MTEKSKFCKLNLLMLETRDVPALLFAMTSDSPKEDINSDTMQTVTVSMSVLNDVWEYARTELVELANAEFSEEMGFVGTASGEGNELVNVEDGEIQEDEISSGGTELVLEPTASVNTIVTTLSIFDEDNGSQNTTTPPKADELQWSDYPENEKEKIKGIHALTAWHNKATVEVDWEAKALKKKGENIETTATVTKITKKQIDSIFNKAESYIVKGHQTKTLLSHERLHLRIAEYIATKALANFPEDDFKKITVMASGKDVDTLRDAIQKKIDEAVDKKTDEFVKKWTEIDNAVQEKYDSDTNHGKKATEQKDWELKYKEFADAILKAKGWTK